MVRIGEKEITKEEITKEKVLCCKKTHKNL